MMDCFFLRAKWTVRGIYWMVGGLALQMHCSSQKDEPKYADANAYCSARAHAECSPAALDACPARAEACVAYRDQLCARNLPADVRGFVSEQAEACLAVVTGVYADAKITYDESKALETGCKLVFNGPLGAGEVCTSDSDCHLTDGYRCVRSAEGLPSGTCQIPVVAGGGQLCDTPASVCADAFSCGGSSPRHCLARGEVEAKCDAQSPCREGLLCGSTGRCEAKLPVGSPCSQSDQCAGGICLEQPRVCAAQLTIAPGSSFCPPGTTASTSVDSGSSVPGDAAPASSLDAASQ